MQGTCMFVWECLKTEGQVRHTLIYFEGLVRSPLLQVLTTLFQHLGMCMDGFMFGSCCVHDSRDNLVETTQGSSSPATSPVSPPYSSSPQYSPFSPSPSSVSLFTPAPSTTLIRPARPPRPPRPPIERVGWAQSSSSRVTVPPRTSRPRPAPPRPPGRPPSREPRPPPPSPYFPPDIGEDRFDDTLNMISTEPEVTFIQIKRNLIMPKLDYTFHLLTNLAGSELGLEAQEDADAATSPSKDIGPCCQQRLFPFKENNPNHHNHHHNDHDHHNNDHNDHDHTSVEYKPDNKSSDTTSAAHHHLSPSLNLHGSDRQVKHNIC